MKNETMALIFGIFMIAMGYEIISSGYLYFRGIYTPYIGNAKFVGPLFVVIGVLSILLSTILYIKNRRIRNRRK
jgi:hypothetical protein